MLSAAPQQIRELAPLVRSILQDEAVCVIGNEDKIRQEQELFASVKMLAD